VHRRTILSCLLVVVSFMLMTAPAGATTDARAARSMPIGALSDAAPQPAVEAAQGTARTTADCAAVLANPAAYARDGARQVSCWSMSKSAPESPGVLAWCDSAEANTWWVNRTEACIHGITLIYTVIQVPTGTPLGAATFVVSHEIELSATGLELDDNAAVTLTASSGVLTSPIASFSASCSAPCNTDDGTGFTLETFTRGETEDAFFSYSDDPNASADLFDTSYTFTVQPPPNTVPVDPTAEWSTPADLFRCDDLVGGNAGCVIPFFTPELQVSVTTHRAAAIGILFAQQYLPDSWGSSVELTRLADDAAAETNRRRICQDGTWVPDPFVRDDSCDEYAFARSRQSGGQLGLTGIDCAEVIPWFDETDGQWYIDPIRFNGTERCSRAHVPLDENSLVGSALGNMTTGMRLLDHDKYWVGVYA
jgi:hypothetical protein